MSQGAPTIFRLNQTPLRQLRTAADLVNNKPAMDQIAAVSSLDPQRMLRLMMTAFRNNDALRNASAPSVLGALMHFASVGIEPHTPEQHGWLVPFYSKRLQQNEVTAIYGYKGYLAMAWNSPRIRSIDIDVVLTDCSFSYRKGSDRHLIHEPGPRQGDPVASYCFVELDTGGSVSSVMPWADVMRIRDRSKAWQDAVKRGKEKMNAWHTDPLPMGMKTAVRSLAQRGLLPMVPLLSRAAAVDERGIDFSAVAYDSELIENPPVIDADAEVEEPQRRSNVDAQATETKQKPAGPDDTTSDEGMLDLGEEEKPTDVQDAIEAADIYEAGVSVAAAGGKRIAPRVGNKDAWIAGYDAEKTRIAAMQDLRGRILDALTERAGNLEHIDDAIGGFAEELSALKKRDEKGWSEICEMIEGEFRKPDGAMEPYPHGD